MDAFTLRLQRHLPPEGNLVWSPYSVASALAMVAAGARGATYEELVRVLGAAPDRLRLADAAALDDVEVAVVGTLWARAGLTFDEGYERAIAAFPGAAARIADFAADPDAARRAINADVQKTTRELIKELLAPGTVDRDTAAVLVNALYLKAAWWSPFAEQDTESGVFHGHGGRGDVRMMRRTGRMPYAEADGWRMVGLAAGGGLVAEVVLGPEDAGGGLPPAESLRRLRGSARHVTVDLALPRFRAETQASLDPAFRALGVVSAFADDADFSGMARERVRLDRIEHKAVLDVDESGFEGAAATAAVVALASFDTSRPVPFRVDRPFSVLVRDPRTEAVFFAARVTDL